MAKNYFKEPDAQSIKLRLKQLSSSSQRKWGTMEINEMLWHLKTQLEVATAGVDAKNENALLAKQPFRWLTLYIAPWPKGSATPSLMNVKKLNPEVKNFENEMNALLIKLHEVKNANELSAHPFFGKMNKKDWGRLIYKHMDHHLRQFGV